MMRATQHFYLGVFKISKYCMLQYVHVCCVQDVVSRCCIYSRMQLARVPRAFTAWRIGRGCSFEKPDLMQQPSSGLLEHRCSILLFHHSLTTCSIMHEHDC